MTDKYEIKQRNTEDLKLIRECQNELIRDGYTSDPIRLDKLIKNCERYNLKHKSRYNKILLSAAKNIKGINEMFSTNQPKTKGTDMEQI